MIKWSDEAINAAIDAWFNNARSEGAKGWPRDMRAALDAAMKKQFEEKFVEAGEFYAFECGFQDGIDQAAGVAEEYPAKRHGSLSTDPVEAAEQTAKEIAAAILALGKGE